MASVGWLSAVGAGRRYIGAALSGPLCRPPAPPAAAPFHTTAVCMKQRFVGTVLSTAMNKSVTVAVTRLWMHPKYKKVVKKRSKIMAHAEYDEYELGDKVQIEQCRPLSKNKAFTVLRHMDVEKEASLQQTREALRKEREEKYLRSKAEWEAKKAAEAQKEAA